MNHLWISIGNVLSNRQELPWAAIGDGATSRLWAIILGCLLAVVALALLVASWTKWGQKKSLTKCIAIAFLAHVWLLMYAYGTRVLVPGTGGGIYGGPKTASMHVFLQATEATLESQPLEPNQEPQPLDENHPTKTDEPIAFEVKEWEKPLEQTSEQLAPLPEPVFSDPLKSSLPEPKLSRFFETVAPPTDDRALQHFLDMQTQSPEPIAGSFSPDFKPSTPFQPMATPTAPPPASAETNLSTYQNRFAMNRMEIVRAGGGDENTEAAVQLSLEWLASAQQPDGGWYAAQHGGGNPIMLNRAGPDGERRQNAGAKANTAMTGLALLAFLGAGHHHQSGPYANHVANGLRYLLSQQKPSGDLAGHDQNGRDDVVRFARMYSHGMASLALAEAYAITRDPALVQAVQLASQYSLKAMNPSTGGWRYEYPTNDPGDTSQFGWQAMFLQSAANAGAISLDTNRKQLMLRFLDSVSAGRAGGLATYRPKSGYGGEGPTPSMTAEAMAARILLGFPVRSTALLEAQNKILTQLPGEREDNFYFWYYATLAMYQMRGMPEGASAWQRWNDALKLQLVSTQIVHGPQRGSWNPSCIWGPYGGRVYTTALACLSLEVYYRYLPIYQSQQIANQWQPLESSLR